MDIGDCLTNIISTLEFTSINYAYFEAIHTISYSSLAIRRLVAQWQKEGHLVAHDTSGRGLWLFSRGAADEDNVSALWGSIPPPGQMMRAEGIDLDVKHTAAYDFQALIGFWMAARKSHSGTTSKDPAQKIFTSAQNAAQNNQALAANSTIYLLDQTSSRKYGEVQADESSYLSISAAHEHFIIALMSSISTMLCTDKGYVPLGARTLIVPKHNIGGSETDIAGSRNATGQIHLLTLDADYTGSKVLVLKASISQTQDLARFPVSSSNGAILGTLAQGSVLVIGPGGIFATYKGTLSESGTSGRDSARPREAPIRSTRKPSVFSWMRRCVDWLQTKGLNPGCLNGEPWLLVELDLKDYLERSAGAGQENQGKPFIVPWPSSLCFQRQTNHSKGKQDSIPRMDAMDLVEFAQTWLMAEEERAQIIDTRKQEREAWEAAKRSQAQNENDPQDLSHMTSPLAFRRASLAGMVYPTPPDAVQVGIGATPTVDGSISTPGPQITHQMELAEQFLSKGDTDGTDHMEGSPQHSGEDGLPESTNNLFGDMEDDDLFGIDNGVTDADFSFFDPSDIVEHMDTDEALGDISDHQAHANMLDGGDSRPSPISMTDNDVLGHPDMAMAIIESIQTDDRASVFHRSTIADGSFHGAATSLTASPTARDSSPPLRPDTVFRRLSTIGAEYKPKVEGCGESLSEQSALSSAAFIELTPAMSAFQQKYGPNGRFIYPTKPISPMSIRAGIPTTDYFRRKRHRKLTARTNGYTLALPVQKEHAEHADESSLMLGGSSTLQDTPRSLSDVDESSDDEDMSDVLGGSGKRKRDVDDDGHIGLEGDFMSASLDDSALGGHGGPSEDGTLASFDVTRLDGDPAGWSLAQYLTWPDCWTNAPILKDTDFVAAARVLTEQATSRNFEYPCRDSSELRGMERQNEAQASYRLRDSQQDVMNTAQRFFRDAEPCTLTSYLNIRGIPKLPVYGRLPPRPTPNASNSNTSSNSQTTLFEIPPPHLEVRRSDSKLTVLPAAIEFWDVLGLGPRSNTKDVTALCLYSTGSTTVEEAELFMENMRSAYETRRFGCHERLMAAVEGASHGIMALDLDQTARFSYDRGLTFVGEKLTEILKGISTMEQSDRNFVLYFVYEPDDSSALVVICGAFESVLSGYRLATAGRANASELVLQLVPRHLVGSRTKLIIPSPSEFAKLAHEVYDRCYNFELGWPSPSISIEPPLPRAVDFKPAPNPSTSLLQENSCLHIAYAQSIDDRWISVAWTDNSGNEQFTTSYCLGRKGDPLSRQFQDVAHEIWETTLDIISARKVHWRLMIAKCGPIEPDDTTFWRGLASTETKANITLTVLTVDTAPSLQLIPAEIELPAVGIATQSAFASTPVSTPQANSVLSPDSGVPSTPADSTVADVKIEPDATLLELSDQTYGAILCHELNDRNCLLDLRPTMLSGYLIKRAEHAPRVMEVNIIWTEPNKLVLDRHLREILSWYGELATLARARGAVDPVGDPRPWHVVMAERICKAMYVLM